MGGFNHPGWPRAYAILLAVTVTFAILLLIAPNGGR